MVERLTRSSWTCIWWHLPKETVHERFRPTCFATQPQQEQPDVSFNCVLLRVLCHNDQVFECPSPSCRVSIVQDRCALNISSTWSLRSFVARVLKVLVLSVHCWNVCHMTPTRNPRSASWCGLVRMSRRPWLGAVHHRLVCALFG